eukprot:COSAG02_NODE_278_length_25916_cov_19.826432_7_plen_189_part_00
MAVRYFIIICLHSLCICSNSCQNSTVHPPNLSKSSILSRNSHFRHFATTVTKKPKMNLVFVTNDSNTWDETDMSTFQKSLNLVLPLAKRHLHLATLEFNARYQQRRAIAPYSVLKKRPTAFGFCEVRMTIPMLILPCSAMILPCSAELYHATPRYCHALPYRIPPTLQCELLILKCNSIRSGTSHHML